VPWCPPKRLRGIEKAWSSGTRPIPVPDESQVCAQNATVGPSESDLLRQMVCDSKLVMTSLLGDNCIPLLRAILLQFNWAARLQMRDVTQNQSATSNRCISIARARLLRRNFVVSRLNILSGAILSGPGACGNV
jgi:hypothetical protein